MRVRLLSNIEKHEVNQCLSLTGLSLTGSSVTLNDGFYHISVSPENLMDSRIARNLKKVLGTDKLLVNGLNY